MRSILWVFCTLTFAWGDNFLATTNVQKAHSLYPSVFRQSIGMLERDALEYRVKVDELEIKKLKNQIRGLKTTLSSLSSSLQEKNQETLVYKNRLSELQTEFVSLKKAYDTLPQDTLTLMDKVENLTKKNNELALVGSLKNPSGYAIYDMEQELLAIKKEYHQLQNDYRRLMVSSGVSSR